MSFQGVSSSSCWKYDVFLSFRGEDTRRTFTDHLYAALRRERFKVFRDDSALERGKEISTELFKAIEESRLSLIVFSKNYASSSWCLDELVKIVECKNSRSQIVIPIFYDVDPSTVRKQKGTSKEAFSEHEKLNENGEKVQKWKKALMEVANLAGFDAGHVRYDSEFIQEIVRCISNTLTVSKFRNTIDLADLVGLDSRLEKLKMFIDTRSNDVRKIGICGMGGIGKTTIARAIFESISREFEGSSFVANVREISEKDGVVSLQKQLLSQILTEKNIQICNVYDGVSMIKDELQFKKVLIVLDDVVHEEQINNLAQKCDWFGSGSRIIITTRDKHLLKIHRVHEIYEAEKLNDDEAYQLFSLKAFKDQPSREYLDLSKCVVRYADGLPLAIKVLGSHLFGRTINEWRCALNKLNRDPPNEILDTLQISFDGLKEYEKKIFLDIACFFRGKEEDYVKRILDGCDFHYDIGVAVLIDKCLITRSETRSKTNILWMHDLLQEMGHQIVNKESPKEPGNRSRLWKEEDIKHVLIKNTGTEAVEAIMLETELNLSVSAKAFLKMTNLRLLKIINVLLPKGLEYLSNELRLLIWHGYSLKSLPSSFQPDKSFEIELCHSPIEQLWKRTTHLNMSMLTSIKLRDCKYLKEIPNLIWIPNLVELCLVRCPRLLGIHSPLLVHKKLKSLMVNDCPSLMTLPGKIHMESLESFRISGCPKLKKFPEAPGRMEKLKFLHFTGTAVTEMPSSIELLIGLEYLDLSDNKSLVTLPSAIDFLKDLRELRLNGCSNLVSLPRALTNLKSLIYLHLSNCSNLESLPTTINGLQSLQSLYLRRCSKLENVPETLGEVASLRALDLRGTAITQPVSSIFSIRNLRMLKFNGCKGPTSKSTYLNLLSPLMPRENPSPMSLILPASSDLCSLTQLDLSDCNLDEGAIHSSFFASLLSLTSLISSRNNFLSLPTSIKDLQKLRFLNLCDCKNLQSVPELPSGVSYLKLNGCASLETLSDAFKSFNSERLQIYCINCLKLIGEEDFILSLVKAFVKVVPHPDDEYYSHIVYPGVDLPKWVLHQSKGSSISTERPLDLYNNELMGFILCSVFVVHKNLRGNSVMDARLDCLVKTDEDDNSNRLNGIYMDEDFSKCKSEHIWLFYLPHDQERSFQQNKYNHINLSFEVKWSHRVEVKSCGIHPIYEQDLINFNPSAIQPIVDVTTPSGSLLEYDDEEPQPLRFKFSASMAKPIFCQNVEVSKHNNSGKFYGCQDT